MHPRDYAHTPPGTMHPQDHAPPSTEHAGRYGQRAGGTHPTGMQSCFKIQENKFWSRLTQSVNVSGNTEL